MVEDILKIGGAIAVLFIMLFAANGGARPSQAKEVAQQTARETGHVVAWFVIGFFGVMAVLYLSGILNGK